MSFDLVRFGELFLTSQKNGLTRPKKVRGSGVPMVNMGELFAHPRIRNMEMDRVPLAAAEAGFLLAPGDLLFARQSLVLSGAGQCSLFLGNTEPTTFESHLIRCRLDRKRADPIFYFYFFRSQDGRRTIEAIVEQGAGASGIRGSDLVNVQVPCPPLSVQNEVAATLSALDDRIALLREASATLEAIAQALFKSWFVDFDPVRAKSQGLAPAGMDEATAALFPDGFEESAMGPLPRGWQALRMADAFEINPSRSLRKGAEATYLEMAGVPTSGHCADSIAVRPFGSGTKFRNGDTLLARITPCLENGKTAFVDFLDGDEIGWGSTEFIVLRPKAPLPEYMAYLLCRHAPFREFAERSMSGTSGRQRVQNDVLATYRIAVPPVAVAAAFRELVNPLQQVISGNHAKAATLGALRDTLLPRLISGQLRLPQAEEAIAEATHAD